MNNLPIETVRSVLSHLVPSRQQDDPTDEERIALLACCLVHPIWRTELQPALFAVVGAINSWEDLELLVPVLEGNSQLASCVEEIRVKCSDLLYTPQVGDSATLERLLNACTAVTDVGINIQDVPPLDVNVCSLLRSHHLRQLSLVGAIRLRGRTPASSADSIPGISSLTKLNYEPALGPVDDAIFDLVRAPSLRTLGLGSLLGDLNQVPVERYSRILRFDFSNITYLNLNRMMEVHDWATLVLRFNSLRTLSIDTSHIRLLRVFTPSIISPITSLHIDLSNMDGEGLMSAGEVASTLRDVLRHPTTLANLAVIRLEWEGQTPAKNILQRVSRIGELSRVGESNLRELLRERGVQVVICRRADRADENSIATI